MTATQAQPDPEQAARRFRELSARAAGSNVNEISLLATDYLNHINEVIMLLEIVPDAPECLDDCKAWQPLEYAEHFRHSGIADRELAIEAYPFSPPQYKEPFDRLVREMNRLVEISIKRLDLVLAEGNEDQARHVAARASQNLQDLIGQASAVIHGDNHVVDQAQIDALMDL
ncbi:hypothetical protein [Dongia sp.]|uniref:hypothetical protein n=1 Tax=Dongia sp. TaxID=1977262 RepID=UPI0035B18D97